MPSTFSNKLLVVALSVACALVLAPGAMAQSSSATSGGGASFVPPPPPPAKGALVDGSFHFPTAPELATTDVMVMYKGDAGYMTASEKQVMEDYLKRGGGLISIHDTLCGDDPQYYSSIVGGSKLHGDRNFSSGAI